MKKAIEVGKGGKNQRKEGRRERQRGKEIFESFNVSGKGKTAYLLMFNYRTFG